MRLIITILFLVTAYSFINRPVMPTIGTNYYVANSGNDTHDGLTPATAWKTIAKVNSSTFSVGDSILFNRGDSWNEKLLPPNSGSAGSPIVFSAYGTGNKPIITGLKSVTSWTLDSTNIYVSTFTNSVLNQNTILVNDTITAKGRFPNSTYYMSAFNSQTQIVSYAPVLTGTPDYTGSEVVERNQHWVLDVSKITSQSPVSTLNIYPPLTYNNTYLAPYFFQNRKDFLDSANEWYYDSATKKLYVHALSSPTNVKGSTIDTLVYFMKKDYLTFSNLSFTGSNIAAIRGDTSRNLTIQNCTFNNNGRDAIRLISAKEAIIRSDSILNSLSNGMYIVVSDSAHIDSNYIFKSGMLTGMSANGNGTSQGIFQDGNVAKITNNIIDSTGYCGITWHGNKDTVYRNFVTHFCYNKDDGGGIYTSGSTYNDTGSIVRQNIILDAIDNDVAYSNYSAQAAENLYIDNNTYGVTMDSNTVRNGFREPVWMYTVNTNFNNNLVYQTKGYCLNIWIFNNIKCLRNIFYSADINTALVNNYPTGTSQEDTNYFLRPLKQTGLFYKSGYLDLSGWQTSTGYDLHSSLMPSGVTTAAPLFYYNNTLADSIISLAGLYYDGKGIAHNNSITLTPFSSTLLFKSIQDSIPTPPSGYLKVKQRFK